MDRIKVTRQGTPRQQQVMTKISDRKYVIAHGRHARGRGRWGLEVTYKFTSPASGGQRGTHTELIFAPSYLTLTEAVRHIEAEHVTKKLAAYNNRDFKRPQIYAVDIDILG